MNTPEYLSFIEVAAALGMTRHALYQAIDDGRFPRATAKLGHRHVWRRDDVTAFLARGVTARVRPIGGIPATAEAR